MPPKTKRIVLGVCGSIAAYKAGDVIRRLQDQGAQVRVVMTKEAQAFITPLTLATLSGQNVSTDLLDQESWDMAHLRLVKESDALLIAPATANIIGKMAHGIADDILTTLVLAYKKPIWIAPAMNDDMYANAIVQENCAKLKKHGIKFIAPVHGKLACGVEGIGHLADVETIVKAVLKS